MFSENAKKLAEFYQKKVGLSLSTDAELGDKDQLFGFEMSQGSGFYIVDHSKVKGRSKEPDRV
ncbi:MAG: hypothetical protein Q8O86_12095, partial [Dehalococcoidia bacterium]|nr:hypothetical protein [Dehalococcoidia bacterium]